MCKSFKKIITCFVLIVMMLSIFTACGSKSDSTSKDSKTFTNKGNEEYKGTINLWSWTDEPKYMITQFNKAYPNINVKFTQIGQDYPTKMKTVLQAGTGVPDLFVGELKYVKQWLEIDAWDNLSASPYNAEDIAKNQMEYVQKLGRDKDGNLRALSWQATPGGFWYKRSMAKQYFGTDDPDKISKMMSTIDGLFDMGEKLYSKSNGKTHLLTNWQDLYWLQYGSRTKPWVKDGSLIIDQSLMDFFDLAKNARKENLDAKLTAWTPAWNNAANNSSIFGYILPTWGLQYVIKASAPKSEGDWAIAKGPTSYFQGGTWMGIYKNSKNKELAWQFLKYITSNEDYLKQYVADKGDFVSYIPVINTISDNYKDKFCGGQNTYKFFKEEASKINSAVITKYDDDINSLYFNAVGLYVDGKATKDKALTTFKKDVKNAYPDLKVE